VEKSQVVVLNFMSWPTEMLKIIKSAISIINDNATLILVIITAVYAYFTYRMAKIMAKQVVADIQVSNVILGSNFIEGWFKERLEKQPEQIGKDSFFEFNLLFDVRNKSSGSGSIDKPILVLKFTNDGFECTVHPKTKSYSWHSVDGNPNVREQEVTDFGGTIFLRGGESQKIELEYILHDFDDEALKHVKENLSSLEYYLKFTDNLGENYLIKISDIRGEREVHRG